MAPIVVLDNGAATIKAGIVGCDPHPRLIPNAVVRSKGDRATYHGHELARCRDYAALHFRLPFEKGYLVDWDAQKAVWDGVFSDEVLSVDTTEAALLITEPYFNLPNIQDTYDQLVFEEYEFAACRRVPPAALIPHGPLFAQPGLPPAQCTVVVDAGFSFTHVVPMLDGQILWHAVKRLDVGGKLLTNHLKELVSFRQWNMMDETHVMNHVKELCCFVSDDYARDVERCRTAPSTIVQEYVLPDLSAQRAGHVRLPGEAPHADGQILRMAGERFAVPEVLFRPDDVGLDQAGLAPTIALAISLLPGDLQGMFWANIGLVGGCVRFRGLRERLMAELRALAPADVDVEIYECDDPITQAYTSAYAFASARQHSAGAAGAGAAGAGEWAVTRAEYLESGGSAARRKFGDWASASAEREGDYDMDVDGERERKDRERERERRERAREEWEEREDEREREREREKGARARARGKAARQAQGGKPTQAAEGHPQGDVPGDADGGDASPDGIPQQDAPEVVGGTRGATRGARSTRAVTGPGAPPPTPASGGSASATGRKR